MKRVFDIVFASVMALVLLPLMFAVAVAIRVVYGAPVLFRQVRLGRGCRKFFLLKFRTMLVGSEKTGTGVVVRSGDERITRLGRFLRQWSLDELPQLLNVLKGDMSMVGPRPVLPEHPKPLQEYSDLELKRFTVRPGITGWAQINGRGALTWAEKFRLDLDYINKRSMLFDIYIIVRTAVKTVKRADLYIDSKPSGERDRVKL